MGRSIVGFETWTTEELQENRRKHKGGGARRPSQARTMTEVERAWVGAFIEADGCAFLRRGVTVTVSVGQKEIDPLATLLRLTEVGRIQRDSHEQWSWNVWAANDALDIARQCALYSWKLQRILKENDNVEVSNS